jgi:hypothetical protein
MEQDNEVKSSNIYISVVGVCLYILVFLQLVNFLDQSVTIAPLVSFNRVAAQNPIAADTFNMIANKSNSNDKSDQKIIVVTGSASPSVGHVPSLPPKTSNDTQDYDRFSCNEIIRKKQRNRYKYCLVDANGALQNLFESSFYDCRDFYDCYAPVKRKKNGPFDVIDCYGNVITKRIEEYNSIGEFHEGLASVFDDKKQFAGYINIHARLLINIKRIFPDVEFIEGSDFADGKAYLFKVGGGIIQIDTIGRKLRIIGN